MAADYSDAMSEEKKALRKLIRQRKSAFTPTQLKALSAPIVTRILAHPKVMKSHCVLLYYSMSDEVNTHALVEQLYNQGKTVLLPVVENATDLTLKRYTGTADLQESRAFHIGEPTGEAFHDYEQIEVALIPGMSFDSKGNRLGRGKGYYDRLLARMPSLYKIGVCFDFQKTAQIPAEESDIQMNEVL